MQTKVFNLSQNHSLFNQFIAEIRDEVIQQDRLRFRRNLERIGEVMAYEISKTMNFAEREVVTPLGTAEAVVLAEQPVVASILRAGIPLHNGLLHFFDQAGNAFVAAYRKHTTEENFEIKVEYMSSPHLKDKVLILADPMLATGRSMVLCYQALLQKGKPKHTHVACVVASTEGLDFLKKQLPDNTTIWCGAIDDELTAQAFIVPGLGDAGDLAYGEKE